jgi:hypothetical protein
MTPFPLEGLVDWLLEASGLSEGLGDGEGEGKESSEDDELAGLFVGLGGGEDEVPTQPRPRPPQSSEFRFADGTLFGLVDGEGLCGQPIPKRSQSSEDGGSGGVFKGGVLEGDGVFVGGGVFEGGGVFVGSELFEGLGDGEGVGEGVGPMHSIPMAPQSCEDDELPDAGSFGGLGEGLVEVEVEVEVAVPPRQMPAMQTAGGFDDVGLFEGLGVGEGLGDGEWLGDGDEPRQPIPSAPQSSEFDGLADAALF